MQNINKKQNRIKTGDAAFHVVNTLFLFMILVVCVFPFLYMFALSFSSAKAVTNNRVFLWPVEFNTSAYQTILKYPNFFTAYGNTFKYTILGTAIALFMTLMFAYPLSKPHLRGTKWTMRLVIFSMFFSGGMIPRYLLVSSLGITDTIFAIILPFAISQFNLIILINFLKGLPESVEEAAIIDGMGYFGILAKIVIPLSVPALATIGLYYAVFFWNDWFYGLIFMNSNKRYPVMLFLRNIVDGHAISGASSGTSQDSTTVYSTLKSATILLTTAPIIALYPFLQRYFVKGLTVGAVKG